MVDQLAFLRMYMAGLSFMTRSDSSPSHTTDTLFAVVVADRDGTVVETPYDIQSPDTAPALAPISDSASDLPPWAQHDFSRGSSSVDRLQSSASREGSSPQLQPPSTSSTRPQLRRMLSKRHLNAYYVVDIAVDAAEIPVRQDKLDQLFDMYSHSDQGSLSAVSMSPTRVVTSKSKGVIANVWKTTVARFTDGQAQLTPVPNPPEPALAYSHHTMVCVWSLSVCVYGV